MCSSDLKGRRPVPVYRPAEHAQRGQVAISEETWQAYRHRREQVVARAPKARKATYKLTALLTCGHCGSPAKHTSNRGGVNGRTVICSRHANGSRCVPLATTRLQLEAEVRAQIAAELADTQGQWERENAVAARDERVVARTDALLAERADLQRQLVKLADAVLRDVIDEDTAQVLREEKKARLAEIQVVLDRPTAPKSKVSTEAFTTALEAWDDLSPEVVNTAMTHLIDTVIVRRDGVRIIWSWDVL